MIDAFVEPVTVEDIMGVASWNRERTSRELRSFIESHHAALPADLVLE